MEFILRMSAFIYPLVIFSVPFLFFFSMEKIFPLRKATFVFYRRLGINLLITTLAFLTVYLCVKPAIRTAIGLPLTYEIGLISFTSFPLIVRWILAFLLLDLSFYYWHLLNHRIPFLWRFHNVHHCDPDLDTTTAFRFHFFETIQQQDTEKGCRCQEENPNEESNHDGS